MARRSKSRTPGTTPGEDFEERILDIDVVDEMQGSYLEYAYSVIYSRALPDARDGMKPVQRRILYQMHEMGLRPDRSYVKCARVVGEVMGKLHPHGDSPIYDALVRMAQGFSMRLPLVDGHGNFGSLGNDDPPAAMRYTECRSAPAAGLMVESIDEETVDFGANYDGSEEEPVTLPAAYPNLLVNGSSGIAVGMATNMAPHNLSEVIAAARHLIKHPGADLETLMGFIPGPDLPTGGKIVGLEGIKDAYVSGRGTFKIRATTAVEQVTPRRKGIVVTELPFAVGPEKVISKIKDLVNSKKLQGIADVKDLTDREHGLRLVIEIKNGFNPEAVLTQLYKLTPMEESFGINNVALVDGQPLTLGLKELLEVYVDHRFNVVRRRSEFRRSKRRDRLHLVEGLLVALVDIDEVIRIIRSSENAAEAKGALISRFGLSEIQTQYILDTPLQPADEVRPPGAGGRAGQAQGRDRAADPDPGLGRRTAQARLLRAVRRRQEVRHPAPHRAAGRHRGAGGLRAAGGRRRPVPRAPVLHGPAGTYRERGDELHRARQTPEARRDRLRRTRDHPGRGRRGHLDRTAAAAHGRGPAPAAGERLLPQPCGRGTGLGVPLAGERRDADLSQHTG